MTKALNDNFVCTYRKVGTFQIINGQKVGGNVASYFCLADGSVLHAVAGRVDANKFLQEVRWASDTRKAAQLAATDLRTEKLSMTAYAKYIRKAQGERYHQEVHTRPGDRDTIPRDMPRLASQQAKTHWLIAQRPLDRLEPISQIVWQQILNEKLSDLPVVK